ncbi:glycosyltransferase family 1 protein [Trichoderma asperellum CBS 433.97]|uniref:Glycosyltransferase family 1 protein n=1 Tax=Trichoderma asperellum (strain ATCC 204424 / CBS 433.97 / NBRC 101777) TaxID=1042311 RepID=A0A2T3YU99_TRIA4|nr:glycosyltransferase family 1 protein [Trichoderma asperellum CBS 433.97]PTB36117.1 glycosyltransferase family 1 protein [Trichoderma asperellum CBS 433.97]
MLDTQQQIDTLEKLDTYFLQTGLEMKELTTWKEEDPGRTAANASGLRSAAFIKAKSSIIEEEDEFFFSVPPQYSPRSSAFPILPNIQDAHRVRIATHNIFANFIRSTNLEFFPISGDPAELMAYMVSNPTQSPSLPLIREGAIHRKRQMYEQMLAGFWEACVLPDPEIGFPFVADAILANPPSFTHVQCAEVLGVPVHMVFAIPWSSTGGAWAARDGKRECHGELCFICCRGLLTWQGLGDIANDWRVNILDLEPITAISSASISSVVSVADAATRE